MEAVSLPPEKSGTQPELEVATFAPDVPEANRARAALIAGAISVMAASAVFLVLTREPKQAPAAPVVIAPAPIVAPPPKPPSDEIRLEFDVDPPDATVQIDGRTVGGSLVVPRSSTPLKIEVTAPGRNAYTRTLVPDRSHVVAVKLEPIEVAKPRPVRRVAPRSGRVLLRGDDL
jgi:hypothetical protein